MVKGSFTTVKRAPPCNGTLREQKGASTLSGALWVIRERWQRSKVAKYTFFFTFQSEFYFEKILLL